MRKRRQQAYTFVTLFKPDIQELIGLFQAQLQDVDIVMDNHRILDSAQLDQFDPAYQARSLLLRGHAQQPPEANEFRLRASGGWHKTMLNGELLVIDTL